MHSSGGYLTQAAYTNAVVHDVHPGEDVYWCTADVGWVTGHTYGVYGPLSNGATCIVYEGTPNSPNEHRHFEIIERYGMTETLITVSARVDGERRPGWVGLPITGVESRIIASVRASRSSSLSCPKASLC